MWDLPEKNHLASSQDWNRRCKYSFYGVVQEKVSSGLGFSSSKFAIYWTEKKGTGKYNWIYG